MMRPRLGSLVRVLRQARGLSQAQAAQAAGIGRVTLGCWEKGSHQPRVVDLEALLSALAVSPEERRQALALLDSPRVRAQTRGVIARLGEQTGIGPMPLGGDLLRALRHRRGLSQEETARRIGVTVRTLRRWEKSDIWPSSAPLQTLCHVLEARTEEMLALTTGLLSPTSETESVSLDEIRARGRRLFYAIGGQREALKELNLLMLEAQVWPRAARSEAGREVLSHLYSYHAQYLARYERFAESGAYAHRALDLLPSGARPDEVQVMAGITTAQAAVYRGTRPTPQRGLEVLRHWQEAAPWPEYEAWLLSDMAQYLVLSGDAGHGLEMARRASAMAARCNNPHELYNRELAEARMLVWAGQPKPALVLMEPHRDALPAQARLLEVSAYLDLQEPSSAHDRLQEALQMIEDRGLAHLQPQAQRLTLRF